jgi:preprotein translocase subunit SecD
MFLVVVLVWLNFPEGRPLKLSLGKLKIDTILSPPKISTTVNDKPYVREFITRLGLDLQGGSHFVFDTDIKNIKPADLKDALDATRNIVERRVNLFGVSEPVVQTLKSGSQYRISRDKW